MGQKAPRYAPWLGQLSALAKGFQMTKLRAFIEQAYAEVEREQAQGHGG